VSPRRTEAVEPDGDKHDRRRAILAATVRVIALEGLEAVTHRRVADQAGVPLGSTTYYFASREELVREAFRYYAAETLDALARVERDFPGRTAADLVDLLVEVARREFTAPDMVRVEYELILRGARDPLLARDVADYERDLAARLAEALERLGAAQPFDVARSVLALFRGFELERLTRPDADLEDLRRRLLAVISALTAASTAKSRAAHRPARPLVPHRPRRRPGRARPARRSSP
jgi:TetR/AcrR family transcriptional regulator, regulator of biofilm formation and stress response